MSQYPHIKNGISIHAAREGGDGYISVPNHQPCISIHAAREGGDEIVSQSPRDAELFQSTPPVKAATRFFSANSTLGKNFNPRRP